MDVSPQKPIWDRSYSLHFGVLVLLTFVLLLNFCISVAALVEAKIDGGTTLSALQLQTLNDITNNLSFTSSGVLIAHGFTTNSSSSSSSSRSRFKSSTKLSSNTFSVVGGDMKVATVLANSYIIDSPNIVSMTSSGFVAKSTTTNLQAQLTPNGSLILTNPTGNPITFTSNTRGDLLLTSATNTYFKLSTPLQLQNLTTTQRNALTLVGDGTMVFDTDIDNLFVWANNQWNEANVTIVGTAGQIAVNAGVVSLVSTGVAPGTYDLATITVDTFGRVTSAISTTGFITSVNGTSGQINAVTTLGDVTLSLTTTAVTPGAYTWLNATVDSFGRLTSASSNAAPVINVTGTTNYISVSGTTSHPIIDIATQSKNAIDSWRVLAPAASPSPAILQFLRYNGTQLAWVYVGNQPFPTSRTIFVDKSGSDATGNGTEASPFLTVSAALALALPGTSSTNQTAIIIGAGTYIENNSSAPISITASGICLVGRSNRSTFLVPSDPTKNLFTCAGVNIVCVNLSFSVTTPGTSTASCFGLTGAFQSLFTSCLFRFFSTGVSIIGTGTPSSSVLFEACTFGQCGISINAESTVFLSNDGQFRGSFGATPSTSYNGILSGGSGTFGYVTGCVFVYEGYAMQVTSSSNVNISGCSFGYNDQAIVANSQGIVNISACTFAQMDNDGSFGRQQAVNLSNAGTNATISACTIDGRNTSGMVEGIGVIVTDSASLNMQSTIISDCFLGVQLGKADNTDTSSTQLVISNGSFQSNTTSMILHGTISNSPLFIGAMLNIEDLASFSFDTVQNVKLSFATTSTGDGFIGMGTFTNNDMTLIDVAAKLSNTSYLQYYASFYSAESLAFVDPDPSVSSALICVGQLNVSLNAVTQDVNSESSLRLFSETSATVGSGTNVRGWRMYKSEPEAKLIFAFQNSIAGLGLTSESTFVLFDATNLLVHLGSNVLTFGVTDDTNLYRASAGRLITDGNLIIGGLTTASTALATNGSKQIVSSVTTATELGYVSGVTSAIQTQLNAKFSTAGGSLTGQLQTIQGSLATPAIKIFTNYAGIFAETTNNFDVSTGGVHQLKIDASGSLFLKQYTTAGILHNLVTTGQITSSLIVDADITPATITNAKLATASSANLNNYLVARSGTGTFSTTMITITGTTSASTDVATKSYVDTAVSSGLVVHDPVKVVSVSPISSPPNGSQTIDGVLVVNPDRVLLVAQGDAKENGPWVVVNAGNWTRPTDFPLAPPTLAGAAYFLVQMGTIYAGSAWVCTTPTATIGTTDLTFAEFTQPSSVTAANVGGGTGQIWRDTVGTTINLKTLLAGSYMLITNNADDITLAVDATSANTVSKVVARDASGNFSAGTITANLIGTANGNLALIGGTMSGVIQAATGTTANPSIVFTGSTTTGFSAPVVDTLSISTAGNQVAQFNSSGQVFFKASPYTTASGLLHNTITTGQLTSSLVVNADVDPSAAIVDTKLATISTAGKVSNSATTATNLNNPSAIVARDGAGNFVATTITSALIGNVTGSASNNVLKAGDTMTGVLTLIDGSAGSPALNFTTGATAGLFSSSGSVGIATSGVARQTIDSSGNVTISSLTGSGVVHTSGGGLLTTSLIVNADVSNSAAITDTKLATISTSGKVANSATTATNLNTASTIVARDGSGNFSAGIITANLTGTVTGSASLNVLKAGDTMTGPLVLPAGTNSTPALQVGDANTGLFNNGSGVLNLVTSQTSRISIASSGGVSVTNLASTGVVHNSSAGLLTTSLIINADVDPSAAIVDTKLATISTAGKVSNSATTATSANTVSTIVARDASGNFTAGTITANLTGSASNNVLKSGDTMTGALQLPAGSTGSPSLKFTGSTTTGLSSSVANTLEMQANGSIAAKYDSAGDYYLLNSNYTTASGILHATITTGKVTSSLIVNADVSASAAIVDTKLATISTAGKVSNSATTATSANTASAIVARDVSGNFIANAITLVATSNQIALGTTNVITLTTTPSTSVTYTMPAFTGSAQFDMALNGSSSYVKVSGETSTTFATATTITAAGLRGGVILLGLTSGTSWTLPLGTDISGDSVLGQVPTNSVFKCLFVNQRGSGTCTIVSNTGCSLASNNSNLVPSASSRLFYFQNNGGSTYTVW